MCSAGSTPHMTLVIAAIPNAIANSLGSTPTSCPRGRMDVPNPSRKIPGASTEVRLFTSATPAAPTAAPSAPPAAASTTHSARTCCTIRVRLAPIAIRTAISRCRVVPRASSRFATLAQTMRSTAATAARSTRSAGRRPSTIRSLMPRTSNRGTFSAGALAGGGGTIALPMTFASSRAAVSETPGRKRPNSVTRGDRFEPSTTSGV